MTLLRLLACTSFAVLRPNSFSQIVAFSMCEGAPAIHRRPSPVGILSFAALSAILLLGGCFLSEILAKDGSVRAHFKWNNPESLGDIPSLHFPVGNDLSQARTGTLPGIEKQRSLFSDSISETKVTKTSCSRARCRPLSPLPGKKGACFTLRDPGQAGSYDENMPKVIALKPSWNYSWGSRRVAVQPSNIEFVPMIWGFYGQAGLDKKILEDIVPQIAAGQAKRLLAYNEPDSSTQANVPVGIAIGSWPTLESIGIPLVGPSPAQSVGKWITGFVAKVDSQCLRMEYAGVHWYGSPNANAFKNSMITVYNRLGQRPIMLTEFAVADWSAPTVEDNKYSKVQILAFMKKVLPWLEAQEWITGYAWFPFQETSPEGSTSALFDSQGSLTPLGLFYASVSPDNPKGDQSIF
jgi:hypothetical protein